MDSIHTWIFNHLKSRTSLTDLIGEANSIRLYPMVAPSNAVYPRVTFQRITTDTNHDMGNATGLVEARFQFDIWGKDQFISVTAIAEVLRNILDGLQKVTVGTFYVKSIHLDNYREDTENPQDGTEDFRFRVSQDYVIWYRSTIPTHS